MLVGMNTVLALQNGFSVYSGPASNGKHWLFDTASGRHFKINEVASFALTRIDGKKTVSDIVAMAQAEFDVSGDRLESDLLEFFQKCVSLGALVEADPIRSDGTQDSV